MARDHRRLAAIVSLDVAGYSRLMGVDESGTLAALKGHRRELVDPRIAEHDGRIVKATGDGLLLEFSSVVDAVRCAVDVQRGMAERNAGIAPDKRFDFRIGINVGDIIIDGDDIFGDGVNVAARLEVLADPGGICVSRAVRDQVLDKLSLAFEDLGAQQVKNIARPVEVYRVGLGRAETQTPAARAPAAGSQAYQAYQRGRYLWSQRSEAGLLGAVKELRSALDLEPGFALAHAALADAYTTLGYLGHLPPVASFPLARPHALRALEIDSSLADAHAALAYIRFYFDWDWRGAEEEFRKALALAPNNPVSHQWYAAYLLAAGRSSEALAEVQTAQRLDPLSLAINTDIGFHYYYSGRYAEAEQQLKSVLVMKTDFLLARLWLGRTYIALGRLDEAIAEFGQMETQARGEWPVLLAARGQVYGFARRDSEAEAVLRRMDDLSRSRFVTSYGRALVYAGMNRKDDAFAWLDKAFDERSHWLVWLRPDLRWRNIRDDPRFDALIERLRYPA